MSGRTSATASASALGTRGWAPIGLKIPKLRHGSYLPTWLLEPRRRAEKALTAVIAEAYVLGVSTRKVENLVEALGMEKMSKSQVSQLAMELDGNAYPVPSFPFTCGRRRASASLVAARGKRREQFAGWVIVTANDTPAYNSSAP
jgi:hypothetical protein